MPESSRADGAPSDARDPRRWAALVVIALSTLMVVLDSSIVTIALPKAQAQLGMADADRQWVITAYALAFGGLLLIGGRIGDFAGRKRAFIIGVIGFAGASALGGLAGDPSMLIAARALQGVFAALLAPAALSLLVVTFAEPRERAKAFGVYGAVQGAGGALGLVLGGLLTEYVDWRWCLLVNVPIAIAVLIAAVPSLRQSKAEGERHYDVPGAILITSSLTAIVYAFALAATPGMGWFAPLTLVLLVGGIGLLVAFVVVEARVSHPLLPLRVVLNRNRGGALLAGLLLFGGMFGLFLFLTYYFQVNLGYSPVQAGLAFLPFSAGIILTSTLAASVLQRFGAKPLLVLGTALGTMGIVLLSTLNEQSTYANGVLAPLLIMSVGLGAAFAPLSYLALHGVDPGDSGVASALVNVTQQVGGALGTALLNTIFLSVFAGYLADHPGTTESSLSPYLAGYNVAFLVSAAFFAASLVAALFLPRAVSTTRAGGRTGQASALARKEA
jgi:EmrB/QacA subfamily drug resistance transporter